MKRFIQIFVLMLLAINTFGQVGGYPQTIGIDANISTNTTHPQIMMSFTGRNIFTGRTQRSDSYHQKGMFYCVDWDRLQDSLISYSTQNTIETIDSTDEINFTLTQASTSAPTIAYHDNEIGTITTAYTSTGIYTLTQTGAWTTGKIFIGISVASSTFKQLQYVKTSVNVITLYCFDAAGAAVNLLGSADISIKRY